MPTRSRTGSTASPSTTATGGSTCAPPTPSRCCGSTWRRAPATSVSSMSTTCWLRSEEDDDGPRSPAVGDPGVPGRQGAAALLPGRGRALQPSPEAPVRDQGRHPRHAHRRGGDGVRRGAPATAGQGRSRRHQADVRAVTGMDTAVDSVGMLELVASLPEQVAAAVDAGAGLELPDRESIENVVILGMGGSGIAGDVVLAAAGPFMPVPVVVVKSYVLPAFVGESSL